MNTQLGRELRRLRTNRGLSLRDLAREVIYDHSYLAAVERGERRGSRSLVASVDEALDADGHLMALFAASRRG